MAESVEPNFNNIIRQIIEKSLFTEQQIKIILNQRDLQKTKFSITKGAYYRQVKQSRQKLVGLFYSMVLLKAMSIIIPEDNDVISRLAEQVSVIQNSDVFPEREDEIMSVIDTLLFRACRM